MADLEIAEIFRESGTIKFRYARYLAADGSRWIRHGRFVAYAEDGTVRSEGSYEHGAEHGPWKDFHPNGRLAAAGDFDHGKEADNWRFWDAEGVPTA